MWTVFQLFKPREVSLCLVYLSILFHVTDAVIAEIFKQLYALFFASWSSDFVNGHTSTVWFMVYDSWFGNEQRKTYTSSHVGLQNLPVWKQFSIDGPCPYVRR